jgi:phage shock protein A
MADEPDNIVLEHLRHIRRVVDKVDRKVDKLERSMEKLEAEVIEIKSRITSFWATMGHVMAQIGHLQAQIASQTLDGIKRRASITCRRPPENSARVCRA